MFSYFHCLSFIKAELSVIGDSSHVRMGIQAVTTLNTSSITITIVITLNTSSITTVTTLNTSSITVVTTSLQTFLH